MYEQISHSILNDILSDLAPNKKTGELQHFYTRLGANFYAIHSLFHHLYGERPDFNEQLNKLVKVMSEQYQKRPALLKEKDLLRERDHNWFLSQKWVGMALYCEGFSGNLSHLESRLPYLHDLGVNLLHIMPICDCPPDNNDGGYAVRNFRKIDPRFGTIEDLDALVDNLQKREILLTLDVVVNHTSNEHEWAKRAKQGDKTYQDYYFVYDDRSIPDIFETSMPEVFPENAPGSFTYDEDMNKWVMTVFNNYQWDLNYTNPSVFIEMLDIILFWANKGADILRLDAVAFLWKKMGSTCQNEREAHLILQLMKDCCQVTAPGVLFIAEAIVAPTEIIKYFGEDAINAKECEIAYNATLMALLWDAVATKRTVLLNKGIQSIPEKLERATWLNYIRCHDDIGLGFSNEDIIAAGYDPVLHRKFLVDYYTGDYASSRAKGKAFGVNKKTGDARISGALASLAGLETALLEQDDIAIEHAIKTIVLLHSIIMSFGGIPLLYYGDAIGTLNDDSYLADTSKSHDNRWVHRPTMNWDKAALRLETGTVENRIFSQLKNLIASRKEISAFADQNNRELILIENHHLVVFSRFTSSGMHSRVLIIANFDSTPQKIDIKPLRQRGFFQFENIKDLCTGTIIDIDEDLLTVPELTAYWLST
jgi:amylosucrase